MIAANGEVLLRGSNVMDRYHDQPDETAAVFDDQGWLHTGDVGQMSEGLLKIHGRLEDLLVTEPGHQIAPSKIEQRLAEADGIDTVLVAGHARPFVVALVGLDERKSVVEAVVKQSGMMRVVAGVGCLSLRDTIRAANDALDAGADAIAVSGNPVDEVQGWRRPVNLIISHRIPGRRSRVVPDLCPAAGRGCHRPASPLPG